MSNRPKAILEDILVVHDAVVLLFDERDAEIARNWQNASSAKKIVDRPLPILI